MSIESTLPVAPSEIYLHLNTVIGQVFKQATLLQMRQFTGCSPLDIADMQPGYQLGQVLARRITLIVISAPEITVIFKIHFNTEQAQYLRRLKFPDAGDEAAMAVQNADYMKELTNQMCGRICRVFQQSQLALGMSIPLAMHGFYELYTDYTPSDSLLKKFGHAWQLQGDFGVITCTAQIDVVDANAVVNLQLEEEQTAADDEGEVEFL